MKIPEVGNLFNPAVTMGWYPDVTSCTGSVQHWGSQLAPSELLKGDVFSAQDMRNMVSPTAGCCNPKRDRLVFNGLLWTWDMRLRAAAWTGP